MLIQDIYRAGCIDVDSRCGQELLHDILVAIVRCHNQGCPAILQPHWLSNEIPWGGSKTAAQGQQGH
jgi:hypothetical protein